MRELLLVRKLEEENAKKNNTSPKNSDTSIEGHRDTADSSTNNITKNTTDTNQTFNRETQELENIKTNGIDYSAKILTPGDKINPTSQLDTSNVDKISEQIRSEHTTSSDNNCNESMGELSFNEKAEDIQKLQIVKENAPVNSNHDGRDLKDQMSEEEKKHHEAISLALQTKRESLKEFFLQKQPYIHKDTFTDNQIELDSNYIDDKKSGSLTSSLKNESIKEEIENGIPSQESSGIIKSNIIQDTTNDNKQLTSPTANLELSPDEKRQKAAANRSMHKRDLKKFIKQKKLQAVEKRSYEAIDIIIMGPEKVKESLEIKNVDDTINENSTSNGLNGEPPKMRIKCEIK